MKRRLFTPGPTPVPEHVLLRMADPIIHHRSPEFKEVLERVHANLQYLFQTSQPVVTLTCSGTGGIESTFVSLFSPGDTIIVVNGGKFGERWVSMPGIFGLKVVELKIPWGQSPTQAGIQDALRRNPGAKAVYLTHSETSTGAETDVRTLAATIHAHSRALVCVDGVSAIGALECRFDEWGIDACVTASQKGLMIPPGLSFVALSKRAIEASETATMPGFYLDLRQALRAYTSGSTPWTPAISLVIGADAALGMIRREGIEQVWARHRRLAHGLRAGLEAIGLRLFAGNPSASVTAVWLPEGIGWNALNTSLKRDNGLTVAGGQGDFSGKIFRISHLGYCDELDMITMMAALERALAAQHHRFTPGAGVSATHRALLES